MLQTLTSLVLALCSVSTAAAQTILTGTVADADNNTALPFVNIGIKQKAVSSLAQEDGSFSIPIPEKNSGDTLTFSTVGYHELSIPISNIIARGQTTFLLRAKPSQLPSVSVKARRLTGKKFGASRAATLVNFSDGSIDQRDIFEIAQLISLGPSPAKVTSVTLLITEPRADSGIFRINFYGFDGDRPMHRLVEENIIQTYAIKEGWLTFDLSRYNVRLAGKVAVAIEFIPTAKKSGSIYYGIKPGGAARSFVRSNSLGEWRVPPHRYRMFVTALVPDSRRREKGEEEEDDTPPTVRLFSKTVQDSFSIFIQLPARYQTARHRRFPVAYLLDANVYFDRVAQAAADKDVILVGIGYRDFLQMDSLRARDYTFPVAPPEDSFSISGGADRFLLFLKDELIPFVDSAYRVGESRCLMGHSLGGYFSLYALEQATRGGHQLFDRYVAASPSLHYGNGYLPKQFAQVPRLGKSSTPKVFLTFGGREDSEDGGATKGADTFDSFCKLLSERFGVGAAIKTKVFPMAGHMETAVPTFELALEDMD